MTPLPTLSCWRLCRQPLPAALVGSFITYAMPLRTLIAVLLCIKYKMTLAKRFFLFMQRLPLGRKNHLNELRIVLAQSFRIGIAGVATSRLARLEKLSSSLRLNGKKIGNSLPYSIS